MDCNETIAAAEKAWLLGDVWTHATATRAVVEANLVREVMGLPGWRALSDRADAMTRSLHMGLRNMVEAEKIRTQQASLKGWESLKRIIDERLRLGKEAAEWLNREDERPQQQDVQFQSANHARAALAAGREAQRVLAHPGFSVLMRRLAARAEAHFDLMREASASELAAHQMAMIGIRQVRDVFLIPVRLRANAQQWLDEQERQE